MESTRQIVKDNFEMENSKLIIYNENNDKLFIKQANTCFYVFSYILPNFNQVHFCIGYRYIGILQILHCTRNNSLVLALLLMFNDEFE